MSIIGTSAQNPTAPQAESGPPSAGMRREAAPAETVDRFRILMQAAGEQRHREGAARQDAGPGAGRGAADPAAAHPASPAMVQERSDRGGDDAGAGPHEQALSPAETVALRQAQAMPQGTPPASAAPPSLNPDAFARLVERHVRQLAISEGHRARGDGQVLLRMADATLPGTDLLLTRTADGWLLRADVRSRSSYDAIREAGPRLAERFAERQLGTLSIEPHLHA